MAVSYNSIPGFEGKLDTFQDGKVRGWIVDQKNPQKKVKIQLTIDIDIVAIGHANIWRKDLEDANIGDGSVSFEIQVPSRKLSNGKMLSVWIEVESKLMCFSEAELQNRLESAPNNKTASVYKIYLDISDLLAFLENYREVSGIQRVQIGYLANFLSSQEKAFEFKICAQTRGQNSYIEIEKPKILDLLKNMSKNTDLSLKEWSQYVQNISESATFSPSFSPGDVILTMGAPWVFENYFESIAKLKEKTDIFYFQIFYDLIPTIVPEYVAEGLAYVFNDAVAGMLRYADHILSISSFSATDLADSCSMIGLTPPPTSLIPMGGSLAHQSTPAEKDFAGSMVQRYGKYVLCVCTLEPRKNHIYLYHIWKRLLRNFGADTPKLICVGRMGWHMEELRRCLRSTANLNGHFIHMENVSDQDLEQLYTSSLFTVFPSLYEGWGLPVSESLSYGKVCVASNATSIPEAGGEWAVYIDPYNVNDGYEKIVDLIMAPKKLQALEHKLKKYKPTSWKSASKQTISVLSKAHQGLLDRNLEFVPASNSASPSRISLREEYKIRKIPASSNVRAVLYDHIKGLTSQNILAGDNWYKVENWGCWSYGKSARLEFATPAEGQDNLICFLSIQVPFYMSPVKFCVLINDREAASYNMESKESQIISFYLPCDVTTEDSKYFIHRIELQMPKMVLPPLDSVDGRILGIGVRSLFICRDDDVSAQLAYWQSQLLLSPTERRLEGPPLNNLNRPRIADREGVRQQNADATVK
jgi:glycosyltransferase involved in cell wall biosynthesis